MTNWIILIVAGFFESCFAFCLGKMKGVVGLEYYFWCIGFLACLALSMDRNWRCRYGDSRHRLFP